MEYKTGLPAVREKSGKKLFFQGQGKVREFHQKSGNFVIIGKVREFCTADLVAHDSGALVSLSTTFKDCNIRNK